MAKYSIARICGHTEDVQIYGPQKNRDGKAKWEESRLCYTCWQSEQEQQRAEDTARAEAAARKRGLPRLEGTPKQIDWALVIRRNALASEDNVLVQAHEIGHRVRWDEDIRRDLGIDTDELAKRASKIEQSGADARQRLESNTDAAWWIDRRDDVDRYVRQEQTCALRETFADYNHAVERRKKEAEAEARAVGDAESRREAAEMAARRQAVREASAEAASFEVSDAPDNVVMTGPDDFIVRARDGREGVGYIDAGEWAIYMIGDRDVDSMHPAVEHIAAEARKMFERQ